MPEMPDWKYQPARDLGLPEHQRLRSPHRESGLVAHFSRHCWWAVIRAYFAGCQSVSFHGREHLPLQLPFILVANHSSHFDALVLACALPIRLRHHVFPLAAGDAFFETPVISAFAAGLMNALPMWRRNAGRHAMEQLRARLVEEPCGYILFPEGTRSRTGQMAPFHSGIGMLVAGAPVPVIPCHIHGTFRALPPHRRFPRRTHISVRFGPAHNFPEIPNTREGWHQIAAELESAVRGLAPACP